MLHGHGQGHVAVHGIMNRRHKTVGGHLLSETMEACNHGVYVFDELRANLFNVQNVPMHAACSQATDGVTAVTSIITLCQPSSSCYVSFMPATIKKILRSDGIWVSRDMVQVRVSVSEEHNS